MKGVIRGAAIGLCDPVADFGVLSFSVILFANSSNPNLPPKHTDVPG